MNFHPNNQSHLKHQFNNLSNDFTSEISHYSNQSRGLPLDFDWIAYRSLNRDLSHITCYQDAAKHYKTHGFRQSRPYKLTAAETTEKNNLSSLESSLLQSLPPNFNWLAYKSMNPDLKHINNLQDAAKHYRDHGFRQQRPYMFEKKKYTKRKN